MQAVKDEGFRDWVQEQRAGGEPPFRGLSATLALCEHGVCWGCGEPCQACASDDDEPRLALEAGK